MALKKRAYPGDLAHELIKKDRGGTHAKFNWRLGHLVVHAALVGIGLTLGIYLLSDNDTRPTDLATAPTNAMPELPEADTTPEEAATQIATQSATPPKSEPAKKQATPTPVVATATTAPTKLPEIDRSLLPVQCNRQATWLAGPSMHSKQLKRHLQLAAHPDPNKRPKLITSVPSRQSIDRTFSRPLTLRPNPKINPERTS